MTKIVQGVARERRRCVSHPCETPQRSIEYPFDQAGAALGKKEAGANGGRKQRSRHAA